MAGRCNQAQISEIRNVIICKLHYKLSVYVKLGSWSEGCQVCSLYYRQISGKLKASV